MRAAWISVRPVQARVCTAVLSAYLCRVSCQLKVSVKVQRGPLSFVACASCVPWPRGHERLVMEVTG
eukprot:2900558-Pyramimonas_sp.AAC.1